MATSPVTCTQQVGWGGLFVLVNNLGSPLYLASNNGGSYFKHITAANPYLTSAETIYFGPLDNNAQTACTQYETMGGNDQWYCQLSTQTSGGGFVQGSANQALPMGDSQVVGTASAEAAGVQISCVSYPSGTSWTISLT